MLTGLLGAGLALKSAELGEYEVFEEHCKAVL